MMGPPSATPPSRALLALATTGALTADAIHSLSQPLGVIGLAAYNMQRHAQSAAASLDHLRATLATTEDQIDKAIDLIRGFQGLRARLQSLPAPAPLAATIEQAVALCRPALDSGNLEAAVSVDGSVALEIPDGPLALAIGINLIMYGAAALPAAEQAAPTGRQRIQIVCSHAAGMATVALRATDGLVGSRGQARSRDRRDAHGEILAGLATHARARLNLETQDSGIVVAVSLPCGA